MIAAQAGHHVIDLEGADQEQKGQTRGRPRRAGQEGCKPVPALPIRYRGGWIRPHDLGDRRFQLDPEPLDPRVGSSVARVRGDPPVEIRLPGDRETGVRFGFAQASMPVRRGVQHGRGQRAVLSAPVF